MQSVQETDRVHFTPPKSCMGDNDRCYFWPHNSPRMAAGNSNCYSATWQI